MEIYERKRYLTWNKELMQLTCRIRNVKSQ